VDIVTEVDQAVEKMVSSRLSTAYPEFSFMGEETYKPGTKLGPEPTFVVDPIDGEFSTSLGFISPHLQHLSPYNLPFPMTII
jgi:fructose-1,6-bisphosphatase/inositol monophosphatase family enzyme